jgi:hypothetical protein
MATSSDDLRRLTLAAAHMEGEDIMRALALAGALRNVSIKRRDGVVSTATRYDNLHGHMQYHKVKQWLLDGAEHEDAQTIKAAVQEMPERRLIRRLARILAAPGRCR